MNVQNILNIINDEDPLDLIISGCTLDEYEPEACSIMEFIEGKKIVDISEEQLKNEIKKIFVENFDEEIYHDFSEMAKKIKSLKTI